MKLQEKCRELKSITGSEGSGKMSMPDEVDKDKTIEELKDKLLQAEKNKEIFQKATETEQKSSRLQRARYEGQIKELNGKIEKLEVELREKTQESKIASSKIRELQSSATGLPGPRKESVTLKPLKAGQERASNNGRLPTVGRTGTTERVVRNSSTIKTTPASPAKKDNITSKTALGAQAEPAKKAIPTTT